MYANAPTTAPVTVRTLAAKKAAGEKIVALTAYDASFAAIFDSCDVDVLLIGDSLGNVIQGRDTTIPVTVDHIVYHAMCVARGARRALRIGDMPYGSYPDPQIGFRNAARVMVEGDCAMVKVEGAGHVIDVIRYLSERDIPVCAHLGLTPQSVHKLGGYRVQGREQAAADRLRADARAVQDAGADLLVFECVPSALAAEITAELAIPTIGIGAGPILVLHDMLGINSGHRRPRFVHDFMAQGGSVASALEAYVRAVKAREFPTAEHGYQ